jgi:cytochrome c peroxidase
MTPGQGLASIRRHCLAVLAACALGIGTACADTPYRWNLPAWVPKPLVPADNPLTQEKVELGRHLFYDRRLSVNGAMACAGCHVQSRAFTDGRRVGIGATGEAHPRNAMGLGNVAYFSALTWANPALTRLEEQAATPMFGTDPVEMGLAGRETEVESLLRRDPRYERMFAAAFPGDAAPWTIANLRRALASFQRTLVSFDSPYDRYRHGGDARAISPAAKRGEALFFSERLECFHCHGGVTFSDAVAHERLEKPEFGFHNTGLYNIDGRGAYPADNQGVKEKTGLAADMGRFRTPSLRNVAVTAPYMHDGSIATLAAVLEHYRAGGRTLRDGPHRGVGAANPGKSVFVKGFTLTRREKADLLAFLESLTDRRFLTDPAHADPFEGAGKAAGAPPPR